MLRDPVVFVSSVHFFARIVAVLLYGQSWQRSIIPLGITYSTLFLLIPDLPKKSTQNPPKNGGAVTFLLTARRE